MANELYHHGILGQRWGKKNGPPYPLKGGDYTEEEKKEIYKARQHGNSVYSKKHFDKVIPEGSIIRTLSYNPKRTKDFDMFYAAYENRDKHQYNTLFNEKIPQTLYDENGKEIGTGSFYKYAIDNKVIQNLKVASEDSGSSAFIKLYSNSRDFYNFVRDPNRLQDLFVDSKYKFKGYREGKDALERIRNTDIPKEKDLRTAYRMFNYVLPNDGNGNQKKAKDIATQRARIFKELKNDGYSAMLDTNDAIYGAFKAKAPVIVFDSEPIVFDAAHRIGTVDKIESALVFAGMRTLGL